MLDNQCPAAWTENWFILDGNPDPAMPVLATDEFRGLVEPMLKNQRPLNKHSGTAEWVPFGEGAAHSMSRPKSWLIDRRAKLIDTSDLLEEEPTIGICLDKGRCAFERIGL